MTNNCIAQILKDSDKKSSPAIYKGNNMETGILSALIKIAL